MFAIYYYIIINHIVKIYKYIDRYLIKHISNCHIYTYNMYMYMLYYSIIRKQNCCLNHFLLLSFFFFSVYISYLSFLNFSIFFISSNPFPSPINSSIDMSFFVASHSFSI